MLFALTAFSLRKKEWKSFNIPQWYLRIFGLTSAHLRVKHTELTEVQNARHLHVRMSWLLYKRQNRATYDKVELTDVVQWPRSAKLPRANLAAALRVVCRRFIKSDLIDTMPKDLSEGLSLPDAISAFSDNEELYQTDSDESEISLW